MYVLLTLSPSLSHVQLSPLPFLPTRPTSHAHHKATAPDALRLTDAEQRALERFLEDTEPAASARGEGKVGFDEEAFLRRFEEQERRDQQQQQQQGQGQGAEEGRVDPEFLDLLCDTLGRGTGAGSEEELSSSDDDDGEEYEEQRESTQGHGGSYDRSAHAASGSSSAGARTAARRLQSHLSSAYADASLRQSIQASLLDVLSRATSTSSSSGGGAEAKEAAAGELAELLGFDHLDLVSEVLEHASECESALRGGASTSTGTSAGAGAGASLSNGFSKVSAGGDGFFRHVRTEKRTDSFAPLLRSRNQPPASQAQYPSSADPPSTSSLNATSKPYTPGSQVVVRSKEEMQLAKAQRAAARRAARNQHLPNGHGAGAAGGGGGANDLTTEEMLQIRELERAEAAANAGVHKLPTLPSSTSSEPRYPHVFSSSVGGSTLSVFGTKYSLPAGTSREERQFYEEIVIPPPHNVPMRATERLVPIGEMEPMCRGAFPGYKSLNRLQSAVYPLGYGSNENLLVCAPTGAGKTDVAMLTVLRCISQYATPAETNPTLGQMSARNAASSSSGFHVARNNFKIVYVAPMKALASEIVRKFSKRLAYLGIVVRELTGDMQLTRQEIAETQMIVTTPEKWDVVTRKPSGEGEVASKMKLLIIDEVHLLHEDRGAVIETIVARTLRLVESSQNLIRIVGLSATLPNYVDVADFLRVNRYKGLFYFDSSFRPVPLQQHFLGIKGKAGSPTARGNLDKAVFEKVSELVQDGHQVMVFVHARKETVKSGMTLKEQFSAEGLLDLMTEGRDEHPKLEGFKRDLAASRNREMRELFDHGFGIHHAGMLRSDRNLSERMFEAGLTRVLCCTATLAWGVNLPAYAVVIKGTEVYDSSQGKFVDLSILDVLQIFGRAGRPQYEDVGVGFICTPLDKLSHYVDAITSQHPIESSFTKGLANSLNAEVALGTVSSVSDAISWLGYTYLFTRMRKQPLMYGMEHQEVIDDPHLGAKRQALINAAAKLLAEHKMVTYDPATGSIAITQLGRIAARYYIGWKTIELFNGKLRSNMTEADVLSILSLANDFEQISPRDNEEKELKKLLENAPCEVPGGIQTAPGKVNILLQSYISKAYVEDFALVSETAYVAQNAGRILRAMLEIGLSQKWAPMTHSLISMSKAVEKRLWPFDHPLSQSNLSPDTLFNLTRWADDLDVTELAAMSAADVGKLIHLNERLGAFVRQAAKEFPHLRIEASCRPIFHDVLQVLLRVKPSFRWSEKAHGSSQPFYVWIESPSDGRILQWSIVHVHRETTVVPLTFHIDISSDDSNSFAVRWISDRFLGSEDSVDVTLDDMATPEVPAPHTELLDLPLAPLSEVVNDPHLHDSLASYGVLNAIQIQIAHTVLHSSGNTLLALPAGSDALVLAALAALPISSGGTMRSTIFVGPNSSHVMRSYQTLQGLFSGRGSNVIGLAARPAELAQSQSQIVCTTARVLLDLLTSKEGTSLSAELLILSDLHLIDTTYDLSISLARYQLPDVRVIGLSSCLQDSAGLAEWLSVPPQNCYSFRPSDRPARVQERFVSFDMVHSQTLMKTMVKPAFDLIQSSVQPGIVFVPSRAQCYITAEDLATISAADFDSNNWLTIAQDDLAPIVAGIRQKSVLEPLSYGVGVYEETMHPKDRKLLVSLFEQGIIRALVVSRSSVATLPIGAPSVVVMATQYHRPQPRGGSLPVDGSKRTPRQLEAYSPQLLVEMHSVSCRDGAQSTESASSVLIMTQADQESYYKRILQDGLPLESPTFDPDAHELTWHILRMIASQRIKSAQDVVDVLGWTLAMTRAGQNPGYYGLSSEDADPAKLARHVTHVRLDDLRRMRLVQPLDGASISLTALARSIQSKPGAWYALRDLWELLDSEGDNQLAHISARCTFSAASKHKRPTPEECQSMHEKIKAEWLAHVGLPRGKELPADFAWTPQQTGRIILARYFALGTGTAASLAEDDELNAAEADVLMQLLETM